MPTAVRMPELGESVDEATITQWLKGEGEQVKEFEPLLEVNTDKVDTEIPSPASGVVLKILASPDQTVQAGMTLAWIGAPGEALPDGLTPAPATSSSPDRVDPETPGMPVQFQPQIVRPGRDRDLGFISPVVARMASEHQLDLSAIQGTGAEGRITKLDVLAYLENRPAMRAAPTRKSDHADNGQPARQPAAPPPAPAGAPGEVVKLTAIRRMIADHMVHSKRTSPHVTTVMEADMQRVVAHRSEHKPLFAHDGVNLTYTAYFIAAIAAALRKHPLVNSSWGEDGIHLHKDIHIGMATALEGDGLIVPVIRSADNLSLLGLARAVNDLAHRARTKQLLPDEVRGGTFTLTNHGTSGSLFATPIINQPQCGILGAGALQKRVVVINDAIAIRPMVYISLTFDHRILDGSSADNFLAAVKQRLEEWV